MNIIERLWQKIKQRRMIYTALPQGKISHAVAPLAQYRYIPKTKRQDEEEDEEEKRMK